MLVPRIVMDKIVNLQKWKVEIEEQASSTADQPENDSRISLQYNTGERGPGHGLTAIEQIVHRAKRDRDWAQPRSIEAFKAWARERLKAWMNWIVRLASVDGGNRINGRYEPNKRYKISSTLSTRMKHRHKILSCIDWPHSFKNCMTRSLISPLNCHIGKTSLSTKIQSIASLDSSPKNQKPRHPFCIPLSKRTTVTLKHTISGSEALSVILGQVISCHDYLVCKHLAGLGHDMPMQSQVEFFAP